MAPLRTGLALCLLCKLGTAFAQAKPSEYDVKAAYIFNFGKFIHYSAPSPSASTFDICILGRDPMGRVLDNIAANETIDHRPVRVARYTDPSQARTCAIVFISRYEGDRTTKDLEVLSGTDVLTVSDAPDFLKHGGMIQFVLLADHVRFDIDLDALKGTHLSLGSELLRVADKITGKPQYQELP